MSVSAQTSVDSDWVVRFVFDHYADNPLARFLFLQPNLVYDSVLILLCREWSVIVQLKSANL